MNTSTAIVVVIVVATAAFFAGRWLMGLVKMTPDQIEASRRKNAPGLTRLEDIAAQNSKRIKKP